MVDIFGPWYVNDVLAFHHWSKDLLPGKGYREFVEDLEQYTRLTLHKNWRQVLSNFHVFPFEYNGYFYNTIEHAVQSSKFEIADPKFAYLFTIDSGHEIGQGDGVIVKNYRSEIFLKPEQYAMWEDIKDQVLEAVAVHKYASCSIARDVLNSTGNAELWSIINVDNPVRFMHLESIRSGPHRDSRRLPPRTPVCKVF